MKTQNYLDKFKPYLIIYSAFIICAIIGMIIAPDAFLKFISPIELSRKIPPQLPHSSYYWDVEHYANMALKNTCGAFYPLWPLMIRWLFNPQTLDQAAHSFKITATIIFCISTPLMFWLCKKAFKNSYLALLITLSFTLNPMAIFRVIGYTESLFSLLSLILFLLLLPQTKLPKILKITLLSIIVFLMALTRPMLIQIIFAAVAATITIFIFVKKINKNAIIQTIIIAISAICGYSIYGLFCLQIRGDFLAPFSDQKNWGKALGLHLDLLLFPKSLLFDITALYWPILILIITVFFIFCKNNKYHPLVFIPKNPIWNLLIIYPPVLILTYIFNYFRSPKQELITNRFALTLRKNYLFWFTLYFAVIHCIIVFFTQDRLFSLGRYIFALPYFFIALGYLCRCFSGNRKHQTLLVGILVSAIALVIQWINYGQDQWLG